MAGHRLGYFEESGLNSSCLRVGWGGLSFQIGVIDLASRHGMLRVQHSPVLHTGCMCPFIEASL